MCANETLDVCGRGGRGGRLTLIVGVGRRIGVGKESDVFEVVTEAGAHGPLHSLLHSLAYTFIARLSRRKKEARARGTCIYVYTCTRGGWWLMVCNTVQTLVGGM